MDWAVTHEANEWWVTSGPERVGPFKTSEAAWRWVDRNDRRTTWKTYYFPPLKEAKRD